MTAQVATELIMEIWFMLRSIGVIIDAPALLLGDNMSVVLDTSVLSNVLKKKDQTICCHRVRKAIAANLLRFVLQNLFQSR